MTTATQPGADPDKKEGEVVVKANPRDAKIEAMTERMEQAREQEIVDAIESDPDLAATQERMQKEQDASRAAAEKEGLLEPVDPVKEGVASIEPMHVPLKAPDPDLLPEELADDPLKEFLVMDEGIPKFVTKVNGEKMLIPLDQARKQLQIGTAAEIRMQEATRLRNTIALREQQVTVSEAALAERMREVPAPAAAPAPEVGLSKEQLLEQSRGIVSTMFSGTEEEAATKLAEMLGKLNQAPAVVAAAPVINTDEIVRQAAGVAVSAISEADRKKDVSKGYTQFQKDYPQIMADARLYNMADGMTDEIEKEHPEMDMPEVMAEAGKRTLAWIESLKAGKTPEKDPVIDPKLADETIQVEPANSTQNIRQERKEGLVRMPATAVGAIHKGDEPEKEERPQTAQEAFREMKEARGQLV